MVRRGPASVFARKSRSKQVSEDCPDRFRPPPCMPDDDSAVGYSMLLPADVRRVREARVLTFGLLAWACVTERSSPGARVCSGRAARCVVVFNGGRGGDRNGPVDAGGVTWSVVIVMAEAFAGGSDVMQAMDQTNPANSRAIAVTVTCVGLPFAITCRQTWHKRVSP